jgi:hypothetical protein
VRVAGRLEARVEIGGIVLIGDRRVEIAAAAKPRLAGGEEAGVHVHGGHMRIGHMRDKADAGGGEFGFSGSAPLIVRANSGLNVPWTVETLTPTFSNTLPFIRPCTPPPPFSTGSPSCSRAQG